MGDKYSDLSDKAFGFIQIPRRSAKPREKGLTIVADKGLPLRFFEDWLDLVGDYVDWVKIGTSFQRIASREHLRDKIKIAHDREVRVFFAGDVTELAVIQGTVGQYFDECLALGADGAEVATAQIILDKNDKAELVRLGTGKGLKIVAEVGHKGLDTRNLPAAWYLREIELLRAAGAWRLLLQGEGILEDVTEIRGKLLYELAAGTDLGTLIIQGKDARAQKFLIESFGPEVSLDVEFDQVVALELSRRGIRKRGLFGLIGPGNLKP
ncbi:MAG: phosphosulfolactate synthase [Deltaproteobacteria bacterium]|jgi:phosphosulfolactate synthase|nr:phosphosulfolactate synthase [Deltaproteobacteria bacterium]